MLSHSTLGRPIVAMSVCRWAKPLLGGAGAIVGRQRHRISLAGKLRGQHYRIPLALSRIVWGIGA
jgi:hypothetical protein